MSDPSVNGPFPAGRGVIHDPTVDHTSNGCGKVCELTLAQGMQVYPPFADDQVQMRRLIDCGVDGMLTNEPARLQALLRD